MKNTIYLLIFCLCFPLLAMTGSQPKENPQVELAKVEKVFQSYFEGIKKYDYQAMREACTPDYLLFEDGQLDDRGPYQLPEAARGESDNNLHIY